MANAEQYAQWIVQNKDKQGTPEFDVVVRAYQAARGEPAQQEPKEPKAPSILERVGNLAAGAVRGAGSIGATLLAPRDAAESWMARQMGAPELQVPDRRQAMTSALQSMGADPNAIEFKGGKLGAEILGTAGAGGAVANTLTKAAPAVARVAPSVGAAMQKFAPVVQSGGLSLGNAATNSAVANLGIRAAGGAVSGAATAGLADPSTAGEGAVIGGALPGAVQLTGAVGRGIKQGVSLAAKHSLGLSTGAGGEAIGAAYQAGKQGSSEFLENMRGNVPMDDVLGKAKDALSRMRIDRSNEYRSGMSAVSADKTVIPFAPIENAVNGLRQMGTFKGQVINKNAAGTVDELAQLVDDWKNLNPAEYHTPEGLDALKKAVGDMRDTLQFGTPARKAADTVYNAVKNQITTQAPTYSKVMKDYNEASTLISEIERTLSLKPNASVDTSMRKLQSLMRNNVNTNYGNRLDLTRKLEQQGGQSILNDVAGQALNSWTPRGIQAAASGGAMLAAIPTSGASLAALPFTSPRLAGESAYLLGSINRGVGGAASASVQRMADLLRKAHAPQLDRETAAALLSTAPVLAASQR